MDNHDIRIITNYETNSMRDNYLDDYQEDNTNNLELDNNHDISDTEIIGGLGGIRVVQELDNRDQNINQDTRVLDNLINIMSVMIILGAACI